MEWARVCERESAFACIRSLCARGMCAIECAFCVRVLTAQPVSMVFVTVITVLMMSDRFILFLYRPGVTDIIDIFGN